MKTRESETRQSERSAMITTSAPLGEVLVESGRITRTQLETALSAQRDGGDHRLLGEVLVSLGFADEVSVAEGLATGKPQFFPSLDGVMTLLSRRVTAASALLDERLEALVLLGQPADELDEEPVHAGDALLARDAPARGDRLILAVRHGVLELVASL